MFNSRYIYTPNKTNYCIESALYGFYSLFATRQLKPVKSTFHEAIYIFLFSPTV